MTIEEQQQPALVMIGVLKEQIKVLLDRELQYFVVGRHVGNINEGTYKWESSYADQIVSRLNLIKALYREFNLDSLESHELNISL